MSIYGWKGKCAMTKLIEEKQLNQRCKINVVSDHTNR